MAKILLHSGKYLSICLGKFRDERAREGIVLVKPINTRQEECSLTSFFTEVLVNERVSLNY
jgi:hypothetical protein